MSKQVLMVDADDEIYFEGNDLIFESFTSSEGGISCNVLGESDQKMLLKFLKCKFPESLEADNALLTAKVKELEFSLGISIDRVSVLEVTSSRQTKMIKELRDILLTFPNKCTTCSVFVDPEECYGLEDSDVMACSDECLDVYQSINHQ